MSQEVEVSQVTIGEYIPFRGVLFQVTESDGRRVVLEAVTVTSGWLKKQKAEWRKKNGKHWRRKQRQQMTDNIRETRNAIAAQTRAWLQAEKEYNDNLPWLPTETVVDAKTFDMLRSDDPALD